MAGVKVTKNNLFIAKLHIYKTYNNKGANNSRINHPKGANYVQQHILRILLNLFVNYLSVSQSIHKEFYLLISILLYLLRFFIIHDIHKINDINGSRMIRRSEFL